MYIPSNDYKNACKKICRVPKSKIIIDEIEYTGTKYIKSHPSISHNSTKIIGEFPTKECKLSIFNRDNSFDLVGKEITVYRGLVLDDNTIEYIPQGIFKVESDSIKTNSTSKTIELSIKDKSTVFDCFYGGEGNINYPCTLGEFINEIITRHGLVLETPDFPFSNFILEQQPNFDINSSTERQLISQAGELGGCKVQMSRTGGVKISRPFATGVTIGKTDYKKLPSKEKQFGVINSVVLSRKKQTNNDIAYKDKESIAKNGLCEWKIYDNPYIDLIRETVIQQVASNIIGMSIIPFELNDVIDNYCYDINDSIDIVDKVGNVFSSTILSINSKSRIFTDLGAPVQTENKTNYNLAGSAKKQIDKVALDVDYNKKRIEGVVLEQDSQGKKLTEIEADTSSLKLSVSETSTALGELQKATEENLEKLQKSLDSEVLNLQNQIDGSIQFWNGAEVPTLNNAPANQWETEEERNSHRADIYTVIINNEQGKSYRFDKVNDNWVWVEITDNELSAVKALVDQAQATANSKMTVYSQTPTVPYQVGDLWWKDGELYKCIVAKTSDEKFDEEDWTKSKYVDQDQFSTVKPTDESEGTELTLKNSAGLNTVDFRIDGNYHQETRSGKNLFNANLISSSDIVVTDNGRTITLPENTNTNGYTSTGKKLTELCPELKVGDVATLSFNRNLGVGYNNFIHIGELWNNGKIKTITQEMLDATLILYGNRGQSGETGQVVLTDFQIELGETATQYEEYGVMPSPDFPSEIEVVEGYNSLDTEYIYNNLLASDLNNNMKYCELQLNPNIDYTLFANCYNGNTASLFLTLPNVVPSSSNNGVTETYPYRTITTGEDGKVWIWVRWRGDAPAPTKEDFDNGIYFAQLNKGSIERPYLPYQNIGVKNIGKNINIPFTYVRDFVTFDNNTIKINGTIAPTGSQYSAFSLTKKYATANYTNYINIANINNILKSGTYTISIEYLGGTIDNEKILEFAYRLDKSEVTPAPVYSIGKLNIANNVTKISKTFTLEKDTPFCALFGIDRGSEHTANNFEFRVQLEKNDEATEYEPYKETITALDLKGEFIGKLSNGTQDYLTIDNQGNYGIQKNVGKVVLNGSEDSWKIANTTYPRYPFGVNISNILIETETTNMMSNYYIADDSSEHTVAKKDVSTFRRSAAGKVVWFFEPISKFVSTTANDILNEYKTWLSENNVTIYYELAEPYFVSLGQAPIKTLEGDSTMQLLSTLDTNMYCKYIRKNDNLDAYYTKEETEAEINITANSILSTVKDVETTVSSLGGTLEKVQSTILEQTSENFTMWFNQTGVKTTLDDLEKLVNNQNVTLDELQAYIRHGIITDSESDYYGSPYIELGKEGSQTKLRILDGRIQFLTSDQETAYISNNMLYINESTVIWKQIMGKENVGKWITEIDEYGNQNTYWGGVN